MKKVLSTLFVVLLFSIVIFQLSCKKTTDTPKSLPGLWVGTYTVGAGNPVPSGTSFFFSFSIYSDGKVSYKSKGYYNGSLDYITFADGTWSLTGNTFSFSVTTINYPGGGTQHTQTGTATYNSNNGTLTNGTITDLAGGSATWTMTRVN